VTAVETLTILLVVVLALATTAAAYVGLLGVLGAVRIVRCTRCGHFGMVAAHERLNSCPQCRHVALFHPVHALHLWVTHAPRH
jgi:hypothetical protein